MEPNKQGNSISNGGPAIVASEPEAGRGDFSLKPAGRRKGISKIIFFAIGGGILFVIVLGSLFAYTVISSMEKVEPVIDERSVKDAPVMQQQHRKDDSMAEVMDKLLGSQPAPLTDTPATSAPQKEQEINKTVETKTDSKPADEPDDSYRSNDDPYAHPQQEEQLFSKINRFESTGMSTGGSSGGGYASTSSGADTAGENEQEARLRQFISADPNELARNLASGTGANASSVGGLGSNSGGSLLDNLDGTQYAMTKARLAPDPKFLLRRRTSFQCVLDTGIRTDYPGFVECHLMMPLYSSDGSVIIARAGAQLFGEQKIEVKAGQSSVFTTWTELETSPARPGDRSVRASLNGLGTDPMGRSGTDAEIDNHWGKRIGGAVMLSTFKDVLNGGMNSLSKNNDQFTFNNTENSTEDLATKVLESTIGIPPTAYVNPGTVINVIVAQDIDFTAVYKTRR